MGNKIDLRDQEAVLVSDGAAIVITATTDAETKELVARSTQAVHDALAAAFGDSWGRSAFSSPSPSSFPFSPAFAPTGLSAGSWDK